MRKQLKRITTCWLIIPILLSSTLFAFSADNTDYIYYSDLFYGYHPYYLSIGGLSTYQKTTMDTMTAVLNDYFDSDPAKWTVIKTAIGTMSLTELLKQISDNLGLTDYNYNTALDKANESFAKSLLTDSYYADLSRAYGTDAKIIERVKEFVDLHNKFINDIYKTTWTEQEVFEAYKEIVIGEYSFGFVTDIQTEIVYDKALVNLDDIGAALETGSDIISIAGAISLALMMEDERLTIIEDIIENAPVNSDIYKGMTRLKSQLNDGWSSYFEENYLKPTVIGSLTSEIDKIAESIIVDSILAPAKLYSFAKALLQVSSMVVFDVIMDVPDLNEVMAQETLVAYQSNLYAILQDRIQAFAAFPSSEDILQYAALFDAYIAVANAALNATEKLTLPSNEDDLSKVQEQYKNYSYDSYISNVKAYIAAIPKDERQLRGEDAFEFSLPLTISAASDTIEKGVVYLYEGAINGDLKLKGTGTLTLVETDCLTVTGDLEFGGVLDCLVEAQGNVTANSGSVRALALTGNGTQTVSGTLTTGEMAVNSPTAYLSGSLTADTLRLCGNAATVTGTAYVTAALYGPTVNLTGGKNIVFSGNTIESGCWNSDLTVQGASLAGAQIAGALYDKGGTNYAGSVTVSGALNCTGASSIGDSAALTVYGTAWFTSPLTGAGKLILYGDLGTTDGVTLPQEVTLCGSVPQEVSGAFSVDTIHFANTGQKAVAVWDTVTVTGLLDNPAGAVDAKTPVYLSETARVASNFNGAISVLNWVLNTDAGISGDLVIRDGGTVTGTSLNVNGTLTVQGTGTLDGCAVTAGTLKSLSALTLANGASVTVLGAAELGGTLTNPTEVVVYSDLYLSGLTASGAIRAKGDVSVSGTTTLGALTLDGSFKQGISGSSFTVGDLSIYNTSGRPLTLAQTITVTGRYDNPSTTVQGGAIKGGLETAENVTEDTVLNGDLTLSMPLTVTDCTLVVNGAVSVESVTLVNATLTVNGGLTLTGGTTAIDESSRMTVNGPLYSASGGITLGGAMEVRGDMLLEASTLTGGSLTLGGDIYGSGALRPGSLRLDGLIRQRIGATNLHTGDLTLANTSKGGVLLEQKLYYSGAYSPGGTALFNNSNLVKEAE